MEGAEASAPSAEVTPTTGTSTEEKPELTTTADMPIAPVYSGSFGVYNFKALARSRKKAFEQYKTSVNAGGRF